MVTRPPRIRPKPEDKPEVVQLARLIVKAAELAKLVNSDEFTDQDRMRLMELIGTRHLILAWSLEQMKRTRIQARGLRGPKPFRSPRSTR